MDLNKGGQINLGDTITKSLSETLSLSLSLSTLSQGVRLYVGMN